jgi:hypothetical protein
MEHLVEFLVYPLCMSLEVARHDAGDEALYSHRPLPAANTDMPQHDAILPQ